MGYKYFDQDYDSFLAHADVKSEDMKYGLPEKKAYPMPDRKHVLSAIKFFNYVSPKDEEALAKAILARMEEYGISEVNVGPDNRFGKYYEKTSLKHYQIRGAKHGVRRWQNPDGSWTPAGRLKYGKGGAPRGSYKDNGKSLPEGRGHVKEIRRLSTADFDGDTVFVTHGPTNAQRELVDKIKNLAYSDNEFKSISSLKEVKNISDKVTPLAEAYHIAQYYLLKNPSMNRNMESEAYDKYSNAVNEEIDNLVGRYGKERYDNISTVKQSIAEAVRQEMSRSKSSEVMNAYRNALEVYENNSSKSNKEKLDSATKEMDEHFFNARFNKNTIGISVPEIESLTTSQIDEKIFGRKHLPDIKEWPKNSAANSIRVLMYQTKDLMRMLNTKDRSSDLVDLTSFSEQDARKELTSVFIYDAKTREAMRKAKEHGYMSLTEGQKDLLREVAFYDTPANRRLKRNQEKLDAAKEKQNSEKYQKNLEQKQDLERRLDKLRSKTNRIRDNKIFNDKDPNLIDRMRLSKERRLENKLSKVDKKISKVDNAVDKYQKKRDRMSESEKLKTARMVVDDMLEATNSKITKNSQAYRELVEDEMKYL